MSSLKQVTSVVGPAQLSGSELSGLRQRLKGQARRWIGPRMRGQIGSSDLIQETFADVVTQLSGWLGRPRHELYRWMMKVMRYRLLRQAEMARQRPGLMELLADPAVEGEVVEGLIAAELRMVIDREVDRLGPLAGAIFQLYYVEGLTFSQIAERLDKTPAAVRAAHHRMLDRLQRKIARHVK